MQLGAFFCFPPFLLLAMQGTDARIPFLYPPRERDFVLIDNAPLFSVTTKARPRGGCFRCLKTSVFSARCHASRLWTGPVPLCHFHILLPTGERDENATET